MTRAVKAAGGRVNVTLAASFGCPFEGPVDPGIVVQHVALIAAAGADEVLLADSIGVGVPAQVRRLVPAALSAAAGTPVGLHLHNTRNTGYANAIAGLESGATLLDASVGGLGGCPFAPNATGNIATEDLVYLLDGEGVETGVDLDALIAVAAMARGAAGVAAPRPAAPRGAVRAGWRGVAPLGAPGADPRSAQTARAAAHAKPSAGCHLSHRGLPFISGMNRRPRVSCARRPRAARRVRCRQHQRGARSTVRRPVRQRPGDDLRPRGGAQVPPRPPAAGTGAGQPARPSSRGARAWRGVSSYTHA